MKIWIIFLACILFIPLSSAVPINDVTLNVGQSFLLDGKNITLARSSNDGTILCINNEKIIISKDKRVQGVFIDYRDSDYENARFKIEYDCNDDCVCDGDECINDVCVESSLPIVLVEEEIEVECNEDFECNDDNSCTTDICFENNCVFNLIEGCGFVEENTEEENPVESKFIKDLTFFLLAITGLLAVFSIIKMLYKK